MVVCHGSAEVVSVDVGHQADRNTDLVQERKAVREDRRSPPELELSSAELIRVGGHLELPQGRGECLSVQVGLQAEGLAVRLLGGLPEKSPPQLSDY
jgi:hypothetical protein